MNALLVVDMQEAYVGPGNRYGYDSAALLARVNERIRRAADGGEPVVYVWNRMHLKRGDVVPPSAQGLLAVSAHELFKDRSSLFASGEAEALLRRLGVDAVELIGVDGNCCVAAGALAARAAGFAASVRCACVGVRNRKRFAQTAERLRAAGVTVLDGPRPQKTTKEIANK